jgi:hypothetical protein
MTGIRDILQAAYAPPTTGAKAPRAKRAPDSDSTFSSRLEGYLDEVKKGRAPLFDSVPVALSRKASRAATTLAETDPKALQLSGAYSTALEYDKKARFVSQVSDLTLLLSTIIKA